MKTIARIVVKEDKHISPTPGTVGVQVHKWYGWITVWEKNYLNKDDKEYLKRCAEEVKETLEEEV